MSDVDRRFHETWLGLVQPVEGLVVSIPVLVDAQCAERQTPHVQAKLVELCPPTRQGDTAPEGHTIRNLASLFSELLGYAEDAFDRQDALPEALSLYVPEGRQTLAATTALKKVGVAATSASDASPAIAAGAAYEMLVWQLPVGLDLDKPETTTGSWEYPPAAKFDRLLRHCRVPIGLLSNGETVRLIYAPHGESSGAITFRIEDMISVGGRPILDAFVMLLAANRFFGVTEERTLRAILAESRKRQANVTNDLADQVFEALQILLRGFEAAAERDGRDLLDDALARGGDHLYKGLLTVLLRLVFVLYAEDRGLLPVEHPFYAKHLSLLALFEQLQTDHGAYPDSMARRFGAWGRLVSVFRAIFLGVEHGDLHMPPRRGSLFNPHEYPFLEGWGPAGSAPITQPEDRASVRLPTVDDGTVFQVLEKLLVFEGQRLSYRALDVEQIGSVYEALMGYHVVRVPSAAVCMKPDRLWVSAEQIAEVAEGRRVKWLKETVGLTSAQSDRLHADLGAAKGDDGVLEALAKLTARGKKADPALARARAGQLVLQPGSERRRTSSHYTPRSLSAPIVRRTLEPLLAVMGEAPPSERILNLKVCDPAMGSGAFLVEACRFLGEHVLAAWTREGKVEAIAQEHGDPLLHARRIVAQRCLYGVDKNDAAVELARLSLWLVTLARSLPFTFLDHSLRHGDSLVGLDFDQIRAFHWKRPEEGDGKKGAPKQLELFGREIAAALDEAILLRQKIGELGDTPVDDREKARLFWDGQDALDRVRLIGDVIVGAFFAHESEKDRGTERGRREDLVRAWLGTGGPPSDELREMQRAIRARVPVFHWMAEFPEIFYAERPDPLDDNTVNRAAFMDAFVGNPPFAGKNAITDGNGEGYVAWLQAVHEPAHGNADLSAHFFRRADSLIGLHGTIGLIATNTIAQGDTRATGLQYLVEGGARIYAATRNLPWPGQAAVVVSVVHFAKGNANAGVKGHEIDGLPASHINSRLRVGAEVADPAALAINDHLSFGGCFILGSGFVLSAEERAEFVARTPRNAERIAALLGGEDLNTSPSQASSRYVIDFGESTLEEAREYPDLVDRLERLVKPSRATVKQRDRRELWWMFATRVPQLRQFFATHQRALALAQTSANHAVSFVSRGSVISNTLVAILLDTWTAFSVVQGRVHGTWARLLSASMKTDVRYMPSDCFDTFPFPQPDPHAVVAALEDIGQRLYDARANYMVEENVGLTITYNRLKDPACTDERIIALRALHEGMDRVVLAAYAEGDPDGHWLDVEVPPFCPVTDDDKRKLAAFEDAVIDQLFALNARRAAEEKRPGVGDARKKRTSSKKAPAAAKPVGAASEPKRKKAASDAQVAMPVPDTSEN